MTKGTKIHTVCIEGPDLSGKTSLYLDLHKKSKYRWNIQDRAEVSMLVFSKYYKRGDWARWQASLNERLKDMNHRFVLLLPEKSLIEKRYHLRGDEIHTKETLLETYDLFENEFENLEAHPNVLLLRVTEQNQESLSAKVYLWLSESEAEDLCGLSNRINDSAAFFGNEALGITCLYEFDKDYTDADPTVMTYELEAAYYQGIRDKFIRKITKEIAGDNEYRAIQNPQLTRRFVYAHDSCISMINCLIRDNVLNVFLVLRSSNTKDTLSYDLRFIANIVSEVDSFVDAGIEKSVLNLTIHSAHIIN